MLVSAMSMTCSSYRGRSVTFALASGQTVEEFQAKSKRGIPAGRFGQPQEFGAYAAFLCGASAGFVTGQNLLLDGGQYPGIM